MLSVQTQTSSCALGSRMRSRQSPVTVAQINTRSEYSGHLCSQTDEHNIRKSSAQISELTKSQLHMKQCMRRPTAHDMAVHSNSVAQNTNKDEMSSKCTCRPWNFSQPICTEKSHMRMVRQASMAALAPPLRLLVTLKPKKLKKAMLTMLPTVDACQTGNCTIC